MKFSEAKATIEQYLMKFSGNTDQVIGVECELVIWGNNPREERKFCRVSEISWSGTQRANGLLAGSSIFASDLDGGLAICSTVERLLLQLTTKDWPQELIDEEYENLDYLMGRPEVLFSINAKDVEDMVGRELDYEEASSVRKTLEGLNEYATEMVESHALVNDWFGTNASVIEVRFQPEVWEHDNAVPVTIERESKWFVTTTTAQQIAQAILTDSDLDFVREDPRAPRWVKDWPGPFTIEVVTNFTTEEN